jgi:hypothetical protein
MNLNNNASCRRLLYKLIIKQNKNQSAVERTRKHTLEKSRKRQFHTKRNNKHSPTAKTTRKSKQKKKKQETNFFFKKRRRLLVMNPQTQNLHGIPQKKKKKESTVQEQR